NAKHIKGAIHLNFSDFTEKNLAALIPNKNTKILIYCNNNFSDDQGNFPTKSAGPATPAALPITLALNIPTYINLYGYGYRNVYELSQTVSTRNYKLAFEGTDIKESSKSVAVVTPAQ
ncbi:MAG TPA: rhodanese-like domain-containing protein, partial [Chitinophagaceae bacterium]|nr:rhodanese-like domain-containing protein [Chitinophagaceae bacterium]